MRILFLASALNLAALVTAASAQTENTWYVEGDAGVIFTENRNGPAIFHNNLGKIASGSQSATYSPGPVGEIAAGYRLLSDLRLQGDLTYANYSTESVSPSANVSDFPALNGSRYSVRSGGSRTQVSAAIEALYDFPSLGIVEPYLGAGAGYYHGDVSTAHAIDPNGVLFRQEGRSSGNALVIAEIGFSINLDENWAVVPGYRFQHLFVNGGSAINNQILKIGLRYSF